VSTVAFSEDSPVEEEEELHTPQEEQFTVKSHKSKKSSGPDMRIDGGTERRRSAWMDKFFGPNVA
jgi:hypothetical protein